MLIGVGAQALWRASRGGAPDGRIDRGGRAPLRPRAALRDGLVTSLANPKLAVFFVALLPQFVPAGAAALPAALLMAVTIVALDFAWYGSHVAVVARTRRAVIGSRLGAWLERSTGTVLVALGVHVALTARA